MDKSKRLEGTVEISGLKVVLTLQWRNVDIKDVKLQLAAVASNISTEWGDGINGVGPYVAPDEKGVKLWTARLEISAGLSTLRIARDVLEKAAIFYTY